LTEVRVSFAKAALGTTAKVPTLDGEVDLKLEPGTQPGTTKLFRGRGMPNVHGRGVGDLAARVVVVVPTKLTDEQRQLIEQLDRLEPTPSDPAPGDPFGPGGASDGEESGFFFRRKKKKR
jgi:molecular chaperone DnaJ